MNALLSVWSWFAVVITATAIFLLQLPMLLTLPFDRRRAGIGRLFRLSGVIAAKLNPLWSFRIEGPIPTPPRRVVCVSNHESNADPFLISYLPWEMKWLGKKNLFFVPIVGWSMFLAGDVPVDRAKKASGAEALDRCKQWLLRGMPVMIFPEGTRSRTGELLPFKDGAFRLAIDAGADVLPLAVFGTRDALPKGSWKFGRSEGRVKVGTLISTAGMTSSDVERLRESARLQIEQMRKELGYKATT